jgi:hypothetical protein
MFRSPAWIQEQIDRVLVYHQASVGYSTCFWSNVLYSEPLSDRDGWYGQLQKAANCPYPEPLRDNIIQKNHPILRRTASSYRYQISRAVGREDWVSTNHRTAAFLASVFDILMALNRLPHPGEKRLLAITLEKCRLLPADLAGHVSRVLAAAAPPGLGLLDALDGLSDSLDQLLDAEGFKLADHGD